MTGSGSIIKCIAKVLLEDIDAPKPIELGAGGETDAPKVLKPIELGKGGETDAPKVLEPIELGKGGKKSKKKGLKRWFKEKWTNQRGEIGYKYKSDIYRPNQRITKKTPKTHRELTRKRIKKAREKKYVKGRVDKF